MLAGRFCLVRGFDLIDKKVQRCPCHLRRGNDHGGHGFLQHGAEGEPGQRDDFDLLRTGDAELLESPYRSESLQIGRDQNGIKFGILRDEPLSSVETGMKTGDIDGVCTVDNLGQMQLAGYFPIAFITFFKWLYVQICVKHTDVPAAFLIEKANHFLRGVIIIRDDTGNVLVLLADQLHDRHSVFRYIPYQPVILTC